MLSLVLNWRVEVPCNLLDCRRMRHCWCDSDVSGVELLMNNHQSLKAEIDARAENFSICVNLGKDLLHRRHPRSDEVSFTHFVFFI